MAENKQIPVPTLIYHITDIGNIKSIIQYGILAKSFIHQKGMDYVNIAYDNIQDRRTTIQVPFEPYGCLHDYVPFYFAPRSPMLFTINNGNVPGYENGQSAIVHIVSTVQDIISAGLPFVFTDGHAIMSFTSFYKKIKDLKNVDWSIMKSKYWFDSAEYPDRKRRRQAEFLVYQNVPCSVIRGFGVINDEMADIVKKLLNNAQLRIPVKVRRLWYH